MAFPWSIFSTNDNILQAHSFDVLVLWKYYNACLHYFDTPRENITTNFANLKWNVGRWGVCCRLQWSDSSTLLRLIKPDIGEAAGRQLALPADAEHHRTNYLHTAP
jgi:hypothetical protein